MGKHKQVRTIICNYLTITIGAVSVSLIRNLLTINLQLKFGTISTLPTN